jgi:hypothetical protein
MPGGDATVDAAAPHARADPPGDELTTGPAAGTAGTASPSAGTRRATEPKDSGEPPEPKEPGRFTHLPPPVRVEDTVATHETEPAPDPTAGRDPDRDFMLRNASP